jgi:hypothetical protein
MTNTHQHKISRLEWQAVFAIAVIVFLFTTLPYLYGYSAASPDKHFMGVMLDMPDHMQYFSWMREFRESNLSANKLTPEPNRAIFFNLLWWGMAKFDNILALGFAGMYQIFRFVATICFLPLVYRWCALYFTETWQRMVAYLIIISTSGFGWVLILLKYILTDGELLFPLLVYIAEGNTFLSILGYPHFIAAALYIFVFDLFLRAEREGKIIYAVYAGFFALFLGWQHAYDLLSVYGVLGAYGLLKWIQAKRLPLFILKSGMIVCIISVSPALYSVWLTSADPLWNQVLAQFANAGVFTPNLIQLPVLLGLTFLSGLVTFFRERPHELSKKNDLDLFLYGWFLISFVLVYLPVDYQIHLINGWQVPFSILAVRGIFNFLLPSIQNARIKIPSSFNLRILVPLVFILLVLPTNLYLYAWRFVELARNDYPYYLHRDEVEALAWLDEHAEPDDVVFSSLTLGQFIPAYTGAYAFLAHWAQTVDFYNKEQIVLNFFDADEPQLNRERVLIEYGVDYVVWGPAERALGSEEFLPTENMQTVFISDQVLVFKLNNP